MANTGLEKAKEIMGAREQRALALQQEGKKIIGYLSMHVPLEIIAALDMVPFRITGDIREPVTEADRGLPAAFCPYMRSVLDLTLKGKLGFLDGFAKAHPCDAQEKTVRVMSSMNPFPFTHFLEVPSTTHDYSVDFFAVQVEDFKKCLEQLAGKTLSAERLRETIGLYNEQRGLVRALYDLNKSAPALLSGGETLETVLAVQSLPVTEGIQLLREVIAEVQARPAAANEGKTRVMVWGSVVDDAAFMEVIEAGGAAVVVDDLDEGTRPYHTDVGLDGDPIRQLAYKYLVGTPTARTFVDANDGAQKKDHIRDLTARFGYLKRYIDDWHVDGVILLNVRYCDPHGYELVDLMDYLQHIKVPRIYVEHNYSEGAFAPLRTRVEAFIETLE